jgi:acyl-CoA reductase-like NAD-dependent aldehyde dehydrogenase
MDGRLIIENKRIETYLKLKSVNPANLKPVGEVFLASAKECQQAIQAARKAFPFWKELPLKEKRRISEAARLITAEKGSPYPESLSVEIQGVLEALDYYGQNLGRAARPRKMKHHVILFSNKKSLFRFQPLGVTLIISPWNFPFLIPFCDILGSLSAGNTVVFRPSTSTPLTGLLIGSILIQAGLPPGVLNVVNCNVQKAEKMILRPEIQSISFTGSVTTGKRISELASRNLTHTVLELGGKDPMVVLKDADLERASRGAVWAAFMNTGQSCGSVERLYVAREIADDFIQRVLNLVRELKVGDPMAPEVDIGPMTTLSQLRTVEEQVKDAVDKGARVLHGGTRPENLSGYFFQPTVLTRVNHSMKVMKEETFGPVLPIMAFSEPEEAVTLANDSDYGLTASVWTRSKKTAAWMAERIETGTVTVNDHMFSFAEPGAIWGGIKQTGRGHTHGPYGLQELVNIQFISHDFSRKKTQIWWYPYSVDLPQLLEKSLVLFHHDRLLKKLNALFSLLPYRSRILSGSSLLNFLKNLPKLFKK